jgi:peptide/nickel transport system permease protein
MSVTAAQAPLAEPIVARAFTPGWLRHTARNQPLGAAAALYLLVLLIVGVFASSLAPYNPDDQDLAAALQGPGGGHWLGTDTLGRDILSRLVHAITPSLVNSFTALAVFLAIGVPLGILAGYRGGLLDSVLGRAIELFQALPPIILVLVVVTVFPGNAKAAMVTLGVLGSVGLIRVVRGATFIVREELYVTAARVSGVGPGRIMSSHILRRVLGPILVQASLFAGIALAFQAALAFLGILSAGGRPTWGGMTGDASQVISSSSWQLLPPGLAVLLTVLAFGLLGDAIRDVSSGEQAASAAKVKPRRRTGRTLSNSLVDETSSPTTAAVLTVRNLSVVAGDGPGVPLVSDVTFSVGPGETVALVGESGCGKSMTALALLGMLPGGVHTSAGRILFNGDDLTAGGERAYRAVRGSGIAYVAQDALGSLDPTHTVGSQLKEVIGRHEQLSRAGRLQRALELLHQVKLSDTDRVLASYPHEISGGMAQRVNIALALVGRPQLLVADEPTTALDVTVQADILQLLRELKHATGMSILIITHDWGVVADVADRALVMYAGEVVEHADVDTLFAKPRFPYTAALLAADPSTAPEAARLPMLPGRVPDPGSWPQGCHFSGRCAFVRDKCTAGPIPLMPVNPHSQTRCIRVDELVGEGALPS